MARSTHYGGLITRLSTASVEVKKQAEQIVADYAHDGEVQMEQIIQDAVTETGLARAGNPNSGGNSPGRIDTGLMINQVSSETHRDGNEFVGTFGWTKEVEDYFLLQENGTAHIEAMNALHGSAIAQREIALQKIQNIVWRI